MLLLFTILYCFQIFCLDITLFTYTSNNILLIISIIFSVFLGPNKHLQVIECTVPVWSVISEGLLSSQHQGGCVLLTANKLPNWSQILSDKMFEKLCLLCCSRCRGEM